MAELTRLHQITEAVSLSLQALLEHLPLAPTTPLMPPADAEWFVSAPSSGLLAPAAAEWFVSASGLGLSAPCSKHPCPALPDLSGEAFTSDALKIAWVLSYMKAGQASTYALCIFQRPGGVESFSSWTEFEKEFRVEFFSLDPTKTAALSLQDQTQYSQGKQSLDEYIDSFHALVEQAGHPDGLQLCLTFHDGLHPSLRDCIDSMAEGHPDDEHVNTWYKVACKQWQLMKLQWFTPQAPSSAPASASSQPGAAPSFMPHVAPLGPLPPCCCIDTSPPLAFPHREALYEDVQGVGCESPEKEEGEGEWTHTPDAESPDETIEVVKDTAWQWKPPQQAAFDALKQSVTSKPVLLFPNDDSPFYVEADGSDFATGAVLSQQLKEDGKWHPVAFYSKSLNAVGRNYEIHDKEMLAIIWSLEEWQHFLEGAWHKFEVWTDHKNLEYFHSTKKLNQHQAWWSLYLANFDFSLHHKPGWSMGKPDALSRRADHGTGAGDNYNIVLLKPELFAICVLEGIVA
ncbi:hypothetical protein E4T56_gene397 [Termitomyces sp. T112]|nr:hypothetical protein E4T56_gene397 [Termitomyces sp. T112]